MAITRVGTNAVSTNGTSIPHQFNHTLVAGSNRLIIVYVGVENEFETGTWTVTYGGETMNIVEAQQGAGFANNALVCWLGEGDLPGTGSNQVSISFSGSTGQLEISAECAQYAGVDTSAVSDSDTANNTNQTSITNTVTIAAGDLACSTCSLGASAALSWNNSQNELTDYTDTSSQFGSADLIATGSLSSLNTSWSGAINRQARACAVFSEAPTGGNYNQASFRAKNDNGGETSTDWIAALNANWSQLQDANFRVRFLVQEEDDVADADVSFQLQYNLNSGGWNDVDGSSSVVRSSAGDLTEGGDTTQQIGSGTFVTPNAGQDESDGLTGGTSLDFTTTANQEVELEYCMQVRSADTSGGDSIQLRLWNAKTSATLGTYANTPTITVPQVPTITSVEDGVLVETETDVDLVGTNFEGTQGSGKVEMCPSSTYSAGSAVEQSVNTWSATQINFDVELGSLDLGVNYMFVTNNSALRNATGFSVIITAGPISTGFWRPVSIQNTITSAGVTAVTFLVTDE